MEDWNDMLPTKRNSPPYKIQWSPTGKVRAKMHTDPCWKTARCKKACYAETIGLSLLKEERV
jgi:hypothetical protein